MNVELQFLKSLYKRRIYKILLILGLLFVWTYMMAKIGEWQTFGFHPKTTKFESVSSSKGVNVLWAFVAAGAKEERNEIIRQNVEYLREQVAHQNVYDVDCLIFSYAKFADQPSWIKDLTLHERTAPKTPFPCRVVNLFQSKLPYFLKYLDPVLLEGSGYEYVAVNMDDVKLYPPEGNFNMTAFFNFMCKNNLCMATPTIKNTYHQGLRPRDQLEPGQVGRYVQFVEIQAVTVRLDAWKCWWELNDTEFPSGWIDVFLFDYCLASGRVGNSSIGVMDVQQIYHAAFPSTHGGDQAEVRRQQVMTWKEHRGIELTEKYPETLGTIYDH